MDRAARPWSGETDHRCDNARTISERTAVSALVAHFREWLARPDRVEAFVAAFKKEWEAEDAPRHNFDQLAA